jgi:hypothetical protein
MAIDKAVYAIHLAISGGLLNGSSKSHTIDPFIASKPQTVFQRKKLRIE